MDQDPQLRLFDQEPSETWAVLCDSYDRWYELNDIMHNPPIETVAVFAELEEEYNTLYETIAENALAAYADQPSATVHRQKLEDFITTHPRTKQAMKEMHIDDPLLAARSIPRFGHEFDALTPAETLYETAKNLELAEFHANLAAPYSEGALISGSTAWGANFATRAKRPELGKTREKSSDVDLLIEIKSWDQLGSILATYHREGLIEETELERLKYFIGTGEQEEEKAPSADMYSLRSETTGTEVSIHFIPSDVLQRVVSLREINSSKQIDAGRTKVTVPYLRDFRPNTTSNGGKGRGYDLHNISGKKCLRFHPNNVEARTLGNAMYGYMAESPLGATVGVQGKTTYLLGVIPFFLAVHPITIGSKAPNMQARIDTMQQSIAHVNEVTPTSVPRLERMTKYTKQRVLRALGALQLQ